MLANCGRYQLSDNNNNNLPAPQFRIIGGVNVTDINEEPWQVSLNATRTDLALAFCGGSLISSRLILTAAHCLVNATSVSIRMGSLYYNSGGRQVTTTETIIHPYYNTTNQLNDIGLVVLTEPIAFDYGGHQAPMPICLPWDFDEIYDKDDQQKLYETIDFEDDYEEDRMLHIVGWGREHLNDTALAPVLQRIEVQPVNERACYRIYRQGVGDQSIRRPYILCAYGVDEAICLGDSGGGLYSSVHDRYQNRERAVIVGIASLTFACGMSNVPDIYTQVHRYQHWLYSHLNRTGAFDA